MDDSRQITQPSTPSLTAAKISATLASGITEEIQMCPHFSVRSQGVAGDQTSLLITTHHHTAPYVTTQLGDDTAERSRQTAH